MERQPVTSTMFKSVGHDGETLEVEFHNGKVYQHAGFTAEHYADLLAAESFGKHYNAHVRGQFDHTLMPQEEKAEDENGARG